jgi:hypothetical protein
VFAVPSPNAVGPGPIDSFCRCQNPASRSMSVVGELIDNGGVAHVALYPDVHAIKLDLCTTSFITGTGRVDGDSGLVKPVTTLWPESRRQPWVLHHGTPVPWRV